MENNSHELSTIQKIELEALKELKTFCQNNGISFFLRGGSVMGAIKYSGFVPWDDDADIAVPRDQYDKLIQLTKENEWSKKFYISSYKYEEKMHCYFPRVFLKEEYITLYNLPRNNEMGLTLVDILPLDGAPNNFFAREIYYLKVYAYRALAGVWTLSDKKTVNMHDKKKRFILKVLELFKVNKLYTQRNIYEKLDKLYKKYDYKTQKNIGTITGSLYKKEIFPSRYWGDGIWKSFEGEQFLVPKEYDDYLKKLYGNDYLTRTPSDKEKYFKKHIKDKNL